ncbi:unnamed protein product [Durusdinium trenchii]|uniref:Uncharacterized protein n=1 Tax=Durusdinium trenchii TaxID=1381693 RepID=A0ABP0HVF5_9DINO
MEWLHGGQARLLFGDPGDVNEVAAVVLPSQTKVTIALDEGWKAHCFAGREGVLKAYGESRWSFGWFSGLGGWHCGLQLAAKGAKIMVDFDEEAFLAKALACECGAYIFYPDVKLANSLNWAQPHICVPATALSLASESAILTGLNSADLQALRPSVEAVEMLSRADLLPSRDGGGKLFNPAHVFEARVRSPHQPLIAAMACYGNQHNLPVNLLKRKGLMTHLLRVDGVVRCYHPMEVIAAQGFPSDTVLSADFAEAHKQAGNSLAIGHAVLGLLKVHFIALHSVG